MHERHEHVTDGEPGLATEHIETVATDPYAPRRGTASKVRQAIYLLVGIIEGLIAVRVVLRLLGATPDAGFAAFIYGVPAPPSFPLSSPRRSTSSSTSRSRSPSG